MSEEFIKLKEEINKLKTRKNIICLLLYGSTTTNPESADDFDAILIVRKVDTDLNEVFDLLKSKYKKLDVNVYSLEEIEKDVSYYTREFKLEYQAKAVCIYGKNILIAEYKNVSEYKYKESLVIRSIEYMQNVRLKYLTSFLDDNQRLKYMKKYFIRICKGLLLFYGHDSHTSVNKLTDRQIIEKMLGLKLLETRPADLSFVNVDAMFDNFVILDKAVIKSREELRKLYGDRGKKSWIVSRIFRRLFDIMGLRKL